MTPKFLKVLKLNREGGIINSPIFININVILSIRERDGGSLLESIHDSYHSNLSPEELLELIKSLED